MYVFSLLQHSHLTVYLKTTKITHIPQTQNCFCLCRNRLDFRCFRYTFVLSLTRGAGAKTCQCCAAMRQNPPALQNGRGSMIAINCTAVENEVADNMYQRSELDYLIYNDPLAYADLVLNGNPEAYLKSVTEYKPLD